uniref:Uncharacterized protein n=1 Tax=Romanomermis culicivorax TaxID=13658 RepID=A0A915J384_ROMCU
MIVQPHHFLTSRKSRGTENLWKNSTNTESSDVFGSLLDSIRFDGKLVCVLGDLIFVLELSRTNGSSLSLSDDTFGPAFCLNVFGTAIGLDSLIFDFEGRCRSIHFQNNLETMQSPIERGCIFLA